MLLSDAPILTSAELLSVDSQAQSTADAEGITLTGQLGIIQRASDEVIEQLLSQCQSFSTYYGDGSGSAAHNAAVWNTGGTRNQRSRCSPFNIVVTSESGGQWSPLKMWAAIVALELLYRSALNNSLIDHYKSKVEFFETEIKRTYWPRVKNRGIPVLSMPLPRPAAARNINPGTWDASNLTSLAGTGSAGTYDVVITYVDQTGSQPYVSSANDGNGESAPSEIASVTIAGARNIRASIASLNPPTGYIDKQDIGLYVPRSATGWNVYAGLTGQILYLQNMAPIPIATKTYDFAPTLAGFPAPTGQKRETNMFFMPYLNRA